MRNIARQNDCQKNERKSDPSYEVFKYYKNTIMARTQSEY